DIMADTKGRREGNVQMNEGTVARTAASVTGLEKTFTTKERTGAALRGIDLAIAGGEDAGRPRARGGGEPTPLACVAGPATAIAGGEYVVVLGPSGCGKTTLLRCIAGLETPTAGRIELKNGVVFDSENSVDVKPNKRNVGLVFQNYALWPHMTVEKNVAYPLR